MQTKAPLIYRILGPIVGFFAYYYTRRNSYIQTVQAFFARWF